MFYLPWKTYNNDLSSVVVPLARSWNDTTNIDNSSKASISSSTHQRENIDTNNHNGINQNDLEKSPAATTTTDSHPSPVSSRDYKDDASIPLTIESLRQEVENEVVSGGTKNTIYDRKAKVINHAIADTGMGRYQWQLFILCGFGWMADNLWLQGIALTLPQLELEFGISQNYARFATCSLFTGLCVGAAFWGMASDMIGRRIAFNVTLFLCGVFGLASGGGQTFIATCALYACCGIGVGGNLPVDGALFLEYLPMASNNLLTMMSVWWPVGNFISSLIAWGFNSRYTCATGLEPCSKTGGATPCCASKDNMGWRYLVIVLGCISLFMFACRFFLFYLYESPKYLLSKGYQAEAVEVVQNITFKNHGKTWLTNEVLDEVAGVTLDTPDVQLSKKDIVKRSLSRFSGQQLGPLFGTKRLGITTCLIWFCWATIGLGYPLFNSFLPQYLANSGGGQQSTFTTYRNYTITAVCGIPGSIAACFTVEIPYIGRKGTMAISTVITGVLLFCFTASTDANVQLACSCLESFFQNIMYGVLYAYTPEVFPAPNRGTASGVASCVNRLAGVMAPIVAIYADTGNTKTPIYVSGALMLGAFVAMVCFPIETRGKVAL